MGFKIGAMLESFGCGTDGALDACVRLGVRGVQFYAGYGELDVDRNSSADWDIFAGKLRERGLSVAAVCGELGGHGFEREEDNGYKVEKSLRMAELAARLGTRALTTHIGVIPAVKNKTYDALRRACEKLGKGASRLGVRFAIETGPEPCGRLRDFLMSLDTDGVGVNFDPANLVMVTGDDPMAGVYTLRDHIVHTHAKDGVMHQRTDPAVIYRFFAEGGIGDLRLSDYFTETPLGQGGVDFPRYLGALSEIGYDGYLTIERETGEDPVRDIRLAAEFLRPFCG